MNKLLLKACRRCSGDLTLDGEDWICLQCGAYHYVGLYPPGDNAPLTGISYFLHPGPGLDTSPDINRSAAAGIRAGNTGQGLSDAGGRVSPVSPWEASLLR